MLFIEYLVVRALLLFLRCLPYRVALWLSRRAARLAFIFDSTPRTRAISHIQLAYAGTLAPGAAEQIALEAYESIAQHVVEAAHVRPQGKLGLHFENIEILQNAYALGRGVVLVSAHMGCFVRMVLIPHMYGIRAAVIMKKQRNDRLLQWAIRHLKRHFDLDVIQKKEARDQIVEFLNDKKVVGLFADQHPRRGGFAARFFGLDVMAAGGPAVYAQRFQCPLVVLTATVRADGRHVLRLDGPLPIEGTAEEVSQRWLDVLEARIREHPGQWTWMHRRWRGPEIEARLALSSPAAGVSRED